MTPFKIGFVAAAVLALAAPGEAPAQGFAAARDRALAGPHGPAAGSGHAHVGPHGHTGRAGRTGAAGVAPLGGSHAGVGHGLRAAAPGGRTYTHGGSVGGVAAGTFGGFRAAGARGTSARGPFVGSRGAVSAGPHGGAARGGFAVGPSGGFRAGAFRRGGFAGGHHATHYVRPGALYRTGGYVRASFGHSCFTPGWFLAYPVAWVPPLCVCDSVWAAPTWASLADYCGITAPPIPYNYGTGVVIQNDFVYGNGDQLGDVEEYADQAADLAARGRDAASAGAEEWLPLGVFGMVQDDEKAARHIFQLAINKAGVVRGNYYDAVADSTLPVYGSLDRKTQRVAWSVGDKSTLVYEAGLSNLTQEQTPVLAHHGKERTQQMVLVRLEEPKDDKK